MLTWQNSSLLPRSSGSRPQLQHDVGNAISGAQLATTSAIVLGFYYAFGRLAANAYYKRDTVWLCIAVLLANRNAVYKAVYSSSPPSMYCYLLGVLCLQFGTANLLRGSRQETLARIDQAEPSFLVPTLFPCRTTHTRLFPTKHSFSYSYLLVGVPVDWKGYAGSLLSVNGDAGKRAWFSVHADDYLARGKHKDGLEGKLKDYLLLQGVPAGRYPYAYLVTAPRFLGFSFNPVSFWYLYDESRILSAMILEVNNTFDERRMYYMESVMPKSESSKQNFSTSWAKDFHVSPFNDRLGSYSLTAKCLTANGQGARLDNNIVLKSDDGRAKIVARVFSIAPGVDPVTLSRMATLGFLAKWWWVGFMTNPRILREARILWVKKLQVYYRPEVFQTSIGRSETAEETTIEPLFQAFLTKLVSTQKSPTVIRHMPAAGPNRGRSIMISADENGHNTHTYQVFDVHVLTPAFYSELVRSESILETFTRCCFSPAEDQAMLYVSDHEQLRKILNIYTQRLSASTLAPSSPLTQRIVSCLRARKGKGLFMTKSITCLGNGWNPPAPSEFDIFVSLSQSRADHGAYLHSVRSVLLADYIAFGFGGLLSLYQLVISAVCLAQISRKVALLGTWSWRTSDFVNLLSLCMFTFIAHTVRACLTQVSYRAQP